MSGAVQNALTLSSNLGGEDFTGIDRNVPASSNYTKAAVKGGTASMYVVYPQPDFNDIKPTTHAQAPTKQAPTCTTQPASKVVETTSPVQLGFVARSLHGFDKDGIIIFEHNNYCGNGKLYKQSNVDISTEFPIGDSRGASSFIVYEGKWNLYTGQNYTGTWLYSQTFGPGIYKPDIGTGAHDIIRSVKRVQD